MINFFRNACNRLRRRRTRRELFSQATCSSTSRNGETVEIDGKTYTVIRGNFLIDGNVISSNDASPHCPYKPTSEDCGQGTGCHLLGQEDYEASTTRRGINNLPIIYRDEDGNIIINGNLVVKGHITGR